MKLIIYILFFTVLLVAQDKQLYTCGMHPNVVQKGPGICPICEMDLTPVKKESKNESSNERKIMYWVAPMDPKEIYDAPGKSKMGMDLVPVYSDQLEGASVKISHVIQQNMGVKTTYVKKHDVVNYINTTGIVQFDETRKGHITLKVNGWIEHLNVSYEGQHVQKGETLLKIYSPEVVNAQQEYLTAYRTSKVLKSTGADLLKSAKNRLDYWDISPSLIDRITDTGKTERTVTIKSPFTGVVTKKHVQHGHYSKKGDMLLEVADMSKIWLIINVYEKDLPFVTLGQNVFVTLPYDPKAKFTGKISYIFPVLDKKTRSVKARVVLHNPQERLKVNMFTHAKIEVNKQKSVVAVPSEAVIQTGERSLVIIDNGNNTFTPRNVTLGYSFNGLYEIVSGLNEGEKIVTSAHFLIDSESKLKEAIQKFINEANSDSEPKKMDGKTTEISLPSIQCDQCVETITDAFKNVKGVHSVHIDLEKKIAHINYDNQLLKLNDLEMVIAKAGYHANDTKRMQWAYDELASCCKEDE